MLFEFYKTQNAKKPNSVHCTYLVTGLSHDPKRTKDANGKNGVDVEMHNSPPMSSIPGAAEKEEEGSSDTDSDDDSTQVKELAIILVTEEDLEGTQSCLTDAEARLTATSETRASLLEVHSVHIYSLEPGPLAV